MCHPWLRHRFLHAVMGGASHSSVAHWSQVISMILVIPMWVSGREVACFFEHTFSELEVVGSHWNSEERVFPVRMGVEVGRNLAGKWFRTR